MPRQSLLRGQDLHSRVVHEAVLLLPRHAVPCARIVHSQLRETVPAVCIGCSGLLLPNMSCVERVIISSRTLAAIEVVGPRYEGFECLPALCTLAVG